MAAPSSTAQSSHKQFPTRLKIHKSQIDAGLAKVLEAQRDGVEQGKRPFAAVLVGPDGTTVLLRQFSRSHYEHAEAEICRLAASQFQPEYLWQCFLFCTWEPCAMCAATMYWSNIGTLVYAASEKMLQLMTGADNPENFTMDMPCREVFAKGQKSIEVLGPLGDTGLEADTNWERETCRSAWADYWAEQRGMQGITWDEVLERNKVSRA